MLSGWQTISQATLFWAKRPSKYLTRVRNSFSFSIGGAKYQTPLVKEESEEEKQAKLRAQFISCLRTKLVQPNGNFTADAKFYLGETNYDLMKALILFEEDLKFEKEAQALAKRSKKGKKVF